MISYASITGSSRNLAALRRYGWRVMLSPAHNMLDPRGFRYALDNGAWSYFKNGLPFDGVAFDAALKSVGSKADFVVVPDIVSGGRASLMLSLFWIDRVLDIAPVALLAVQDGITGREIEHLLSPRVGLFVGGSTEWKLDTLRDWSSIARRRSAWCHVGRVNTARRIHLCGNAGVTSFDGTSATRFSITTPKLTNARNQLSLREPNDDDHHHENV